MDDPTLKRPLYNLTVEVTDHGVPQYSSLCFVLVELVDLNENFQPPVFLGQDSKHPLFAITASIAENEPVGSIVVVVNATDPDKPSVTPSYSIIGGDGLGMFVVDAAGVIRTSAVLDRETKNFYWLTVVAEDVATVPLSTHIDVFVEVTDRNDHAPRPSSPIYFASVPENSPSGTLVTVEGRRDVSLRIEAVDLDNTEPGELLYQISRGDPQSFFKINPKNGYITTDGRKLDRETQETHELEVTISDRGEKPLSSVVKVVIRVEDVNDHIPIFKEIIYNFNVPPVSEEDVTPLCRMIAVDGDSGRNAQLVYNISGENVDRFGIYPETGEIYSRSALKPDENFALTVIVSDRGTPPLTNQVPVMLVVLSYPNQSSVGRPLSLSGDPLDFHLSDDEEIGQTIGIVEAKGDGQQLWFDITDGNAGGVFALRKDTGELQLAVNPKHVEASFFQLMYTVSDGYNSVSGKIKLHLTRSVQRRPVFNQESFTVEVSENSLVGTVVGKLNATLEGGTASSDQSHTLIYFLHEVESTVSAQKFKVEAKTGKVVLVGSLDHEAVREHRLTVGVRHKKLMNLAFLIIKVKDENDCEPFFLKKYYETSVYETVAVGHPVLHVLAVDKDSGINGKLEYSIVSGNEQGLWNLDTNTGKITVAKPLSLIYPESILVIKVSDGGTPSFSARTTVQILVAIAAESVPSFTQESYYFSVEEDENIGSFVGAVFAESWAGVTYSFAYPPPDLFFIHPASGSIVVAGKLDFEQKTLENFTVIATSNSGAVARASVRVSVIDSNDHGPVLDQTLYEGRIQENMPAGSVVLSEDSTALVVSAKDSDKGSNALISYRVADAWAREYFTVDYGTGAVRDHP